MSVEIEQAKWAVALRARECPPGAWPDEDDERARWSEIRLDLALSGFSVDLDVGDEEARERAAGALGWLADPRGISPLLRGLGDQVPGVRRAAAHALCAFVRLPDWAAQRLTRALADADNGVRANVAVALGRCDSSIALRAAVRALDDPARAVRSSAARALEQLGIRGYRSDDAIAKLGAKLGDEDARVAYDAFWGLRGQGGSTSDATCSRWRWSERGQVAWRSCVGG